MSVQPFGQPTTTAAGTTTVRNPQGSTFHLHQSAGDFPQNFTRFLKDFELSLEQILDTIPTETPTIGDFGAVGEGMSHIRLLVDSIALCRDLSVYSVDIIEQLKDRFKAECQGNAYACAIVIDKINDEKKHLNDSSETISRAYNLANGTSSLCEAKQHIFTMVYSTFYNSCHAICKIHWDIENYKESLV
ncbi:hypothetical protein H4219_004839 [Mycoemilia scoparia]|uniref:Uncharacterized protein n=1 Tax=Mycoemilia scoparia TaxID=417184 RepID=A0A9W7ZWY6_9FUNG|nr:hypothetical protein H4219_004839 [Mycoemilia scoparia]